MSQHSLGDHIIVHHGEGLQGSSLSSFDLNSPMPLQKPHPYELISPQWLAKASYYHMDLGVVFLAEESEGRTLS